MSWNRPQLKSGVDLQLQSAFHEGQWASVIRLAEKRLRTFNDPYYEIVKICAESNLDSPLERSAGLIAVQRFVKDGTVIKDVDALDLLEWAIGSLQDESEFPHTLGPLKVRCVKASPKDRNAGVRCLESCLLHWDLVSAQQIAAILDRSFPHDRTFFFWNVVITYLLCLSDQCTPDKKKLYGMLALKQIQRASQTAGTDTDRSIKTEEEILLLYRILESHGSDAEWKAALDHPHFGPVQQLRLGRKDLFLRALRDCLTATDDGPGVRLLACDWNVWQDFLAAAGQLKQARPEVISEIVSLLDQFSASETVRPIYLRNILLARVAASFQLGTSDLTNNDAFLPRSEELQRYIESQCSSPACFDDIKRFVEQLDPEEMKSLAFEYVPHLAERQQDPLHTAIVKTLAYQLQYLILTAPNLVVQIPVAADAKPRWKSVINGVEGESETCSERFQGVAESAASLYRALVGSIGSSDGQDPDCVPELAILTATALIKLSGLRANRSNHLPSPLHVAQSDRVLQAALILEYQLTRTPKHSRVTLLLVRIHLILGTISRAKELWATMDVKRTIIDSLSPYFLDRLSTLSPAAVLPVPNRPQQAMTYGLKAYYGTSLKLRMPRRLADAFQSESYSSILEIPVFIDRLRISCTMAMGYIEELRATRALGHKGTPISDEDYINEITPATQLTEVIDYGSVPNLHVSTAQPVYEVLQIGPSPSNARTHLAIVTEKYFEVLSYKPPSAYKPANPSQATAVDNIFVTESLQQLSNTAAKFLRGRETAKFTAQEHTFFELISLLTTLAPLATSSDRSDPSASVLSQIASAVSVTLDTLLESTLSLPSGDRDINPVLMLSSLHGLFHLRDAAAAIRLTTSYITSFNENERARDKSGQSCLPKETLAHAKALDSAAAKAFTEGKARIALLKKELVSGNLESRLGSWTTAQSSDDSLAKEIRAAVGDGFDDWKRIVADSWRTNVKGWELVKWE
ncbi:conserved hypothetical protein [Verticillium alfalfae VaMs.102]|uniref:N-acetyltransferase B complex non catalytic subunit n=1 Tax=Verticillium alfalfae (strain VaMs.102 / ATCC MYA-4576 / FGSC 10136) TaxID=526221 RepID=C9SB08_VERA1|nr:conserved hypothetical protein [Verticillium alfalfae VaMs.102]EEY16368.1 conserved hypothetical protein [Verticillium alfalfae VaMs.102]